MEKLFIQYQEKIYLVYDVQHFWQIQNLYHKTTSSQSHLLAVVAKHLNG